VLLLGSDNDTKFTGGVLTQSMIIVRFNPGSKKVVMLSIPRDLYVPLSTGGTAKIDGAYSYGGAGAAIATVENNFGIHIDAYIWIGLAGLINVNDLQSDFGRSARQQNVLLALRAKAAGISAEDVPALAAALKGQIKTNMTLSRIATLLPLAGGIDLKNIQQVVLLPPYTHGCGCPQGYVIPVWGAILPLVHQYFP
jgi:anionic cell wall polymer biosynthesis LytR-Cps2A-Psr (LCP) family protein